MDRMEENRRTFRSQKLITKNDVLSGIQELKEECRKQDDSKGGRVSEYTKRRIREIERFEKEIKRKVIFDAPEDWWAYSIEMRSSDISLFLEHYKILFPAKGTPVMDVKNDERYCLLTMKAKLLTVEEYAKMHKIEHVTAVTRIRRGKLRSAVKFGKEWRIPALSPPITESYTSATYKWDTYLSRLPIRYELINDYCKADFYQDQEFDLTNEQLEFFDSFMQKNLQGVAIDSLSDKMFEDLTAALGSYMMTLSPLVAELLELSKEFTSQEISVTGANNLLTCKDFDQHEIISFLDNKREMMHFVDETFSGLQVLFSPESDGFVISNSSLIAAPFSKDGRQIGTLGLLGPMRLDYAKFIPYLEYFSSRLTELLTDSEEDNDSK